MFDLYLLLQPNELLYKSAADISKDLGVSIKLAYPVYQQHEKIRRGKLRSVKIETNLQNVVVSIIRIVKGITGYLVFVLGHKKYLNKWLNNLKFHNLSFVITLSFS